MTEKRDCSAYITEIDLALEDIDEAITARDDASAVGDQALNNISDTQESTGRVLFVIAVGVGLAVASGGSAAPIAVMAIAAAYGTLKSSENSLSSNGRAFEMAEDLRTEAENAISTSRDSIAQNRASFAHCLIYNESIEEGGLTWPPDRPVSAAEGRDLVLKVLDGVLRAAEQVDQGTNDAADTAESAEETMDLYEEYMEEKDREQEAAAEPLF